MYFIVSLFAFRLQFSNKLELSWVDSSQTQYTWGIFSLSRKNVGFVEVSRMRQFKKKQKL